MGAMVGTEEILLSLDEVLKRVTEGTKVEGSDENTDGSTVGFCESDNTDDAIGKYVGLASGISDDIGDGIGLRNKLGEPVDM